MTTRLFSSLENPMVRGDWQAIVRRVTISETHLSARILAWRIPWMEKPGGLPSMGSHRDGHD